MPWYEYAYVFAYMHTSFLFHDDCNRQSLYLPLTINLCWILTMQVRSEQRSMFVDVPEREEQMTTARMKEAS